MGSRMIVVGKDGLPRETKKTRRKQGKKDQKRREKERELQDRSRRQGG